MMKIFGSNGLAMEFHAGTVSRRPGHAENLRGVCEQAALRMNWDTLALEASITRLRRHRFFNSFPSSRALWSRRRTKLVSGIVLYRFTSLGYCRAVGIGRPSAGGSSSAPASAIGTSSSRPSGRRPRTWQAVRGMLNAIKRLWTEDFVTKKGSHSSSMRPPVRLSRCKNQCRPGSAPM